MKKLIGALLLSSPFLALFIGAFVTDGVGGLLTMLGVFLAAIVVAGVVIYGCYLLEDSL
jgi:hypothetical protein